MITKPLNCDMTGIFDYPLYFETFLLKIVFLENLINALSHSVTIFKIGRKSEKLCRIKVGGVRGLPTPKYRQFFRKSPQYRHFFSETPTPMPFFMQSYTRRGYFGENGCLAYRLDEGHFLTFQSLNVKMDSFLRVGIFTFHENHKKLKGIKFSEYRLSCDPFTDLKDQFSEVLQPSGDLSFQGIFFLARVHTHT